MTATILEILKYVLPSLIVLISSYLIVQKFLVSELRRKQLALLHETQNITIRMRLQAFERLALLMERVHPRHMVPKVYISGMTVSLLQQALVTAIRSEFEHNLSQQVYVSREVWESVRQAVEQEIGMIHQIAKRLPPDAPGKDLNAMISDYLMSLESQLPSEIALSIIHDEARRVLSYGAV
ncbi:hypothetical protein [Rurimicrobium arvi]|uniref:Uncharacterized protein n=1 Tax=Rurimicrobium arvi TaxID=2049916 RepID=A0ABP8MTL3_9BACT